MGTVFWVFLGSGLGGMLRYVLGNQINSAHTLSFPLATLVINIAASFILGLVIGYVEQKGILSPQSVLFWTVGFCGGFSTFSTFSKETVELLQTGLTLHATVYIVASILFCVGANIGGLKMGALI